MLLKKYKYKNEITTVHVNFIFRVTSMFTDLFLWIVVERVS